VVDLAGAAPGENLQQDHAHGLGVVEANGEDLRAIAAGEVHLLAARQPEQWQGGGDLREGVVVDVVVVVEGRLVRDPGDLPQPAGGMGVGDRRPRRRERSEDAAGLGLVGGYEGEQLGDGPQIVVDQPGWTVPGIRRCLRPSLRLAGSASHRRNAAA